MVNLLSPPHKPANAAAFDHDMRIRRTDQLVCWPDDRSGPADLAIP